MASEWTAALARNYGVPAQAEGEDDSAFRHRVSGVLRERGNIIEAHEAMRNARWDDPGKGGDVVTGIAGAMALALNGRQFSRDGVNQVGDDIAAGILVENPRPEMSPEIALAMLGIFGGRIDRP